MSDPRVQQARDVELIRDVLTTAVHEFDESGLAVASLRAHQAIPAFDRLLAAFRAENKRLREDYLRFYDAVDRAERFDTNAGDSAVSCVLAGEAERRARLAAAAQEPPAAQCPCCGLSLEPGEKHDYVEDAGCVPAEGGDR